MNWRLFAAISTLTGTIVGAGFLGIPYVVAKSGFLVGMIQIILIGLVLLLANLYLGEILLRTKTTHQLPGLAKLYLGKLGYRIMFFSMIFGIYSALVAYLVGEGESLSYIFTGSIDYAIYFAVGFWAVLSYFVYQGLRVLKKGEVIGVVSIFLILLFILILFSGKIQIENLYGFNIKYMFLPIGVIFFAFLGFSSLPEVLQELKKNEKLFRKSIIIGAGIPIIIYAIFTLLVIGYTGTTTPEIATFALGKIFVLLGVLTMFTAFFAVSISIRDIYYFDLGYGKFKSWLLASIIPLLLFLIVYILRIASFTEILGIGGAVCGGLTGILIMFMVERAKKIGKRKPEYSISLSKAGLWLLVLFFILGLFFELVF